MSRDAQQRRGHGVDGTRAGERVAHDEHRRDRDDGAIRESSKRGVRLDEPEQDGDQQRTQRHEVVTDSFGNEQR